MPCDEALISALDRLIELEQRRHQIREDLSKVDETTTKSLREHVISAKRIGSQVKGSNEIDTNFASGKSNQTIVWGEQIGVPIKEDSVRFIKSNALTGADGDGVMTHLLQTGGGVNGIGEIFGVGRMGREGSNETFFLIERVNTEEISENSWKAISPPAVTINVGAKTLNL